MSVSGVKEKIMTLFPKDYKPIKITGAFYGNYVEYNSEDDEKLLK